MMVALQAVDSVPDPSRLTLEPILQNLPLLCLGLAAVFAVALVIYFLLRGKSQYS